MAISRTSAGVVTNKQTPPTKCVHCVFLFMLCTGGANCVLGTFLMRDLLGMPWLLWLLPAACSLGGLLLLGMMLEVPRMRRVKEVGNAVM